MSDEEGEEDHGNWEGEISSCQTEDSSDDTGVDYHKFAILQKDCKYNGQLVNLLLILLTTCE